LIKQWVVGLFFSLILGELFTWGFIETLRYYMGTSKTLFKNGAKEVPSWITGSVERLFFTVLLGCNFSGVPAYMLTWLTLKMATNWNHPDWKEKPDARAFALSALLAGLISMLFALGGGLICSGQWTLSFL
jgi:hypothetical protein